MGCNFATQTANPSSGIVSILDLRSVLLTNWCRSFSFWSAMSVTTVNSVANAALPAMQSTV
jgi:hypothetical protein